MTSACYCSLLSLNPFYKTVKYSLYIKWFRTSRCWMKEATTIYSINLRNLRICANKYIFHIMCICDMCVFNWVQSYLDQLCILLWYYVDGAWGTLLLLVQLTQRQCKASGRQDTVAVLMSWCLLLASEICTWVKSAWDVRRNHHGPPFFSSPPCRPIHCNSYSFCHRFPPSAMRSRHKVVAYRHSNAFSFNVTFI